MKVGKPVVFKLTGELMRVVNIYEKGNDPFKPTYVLRRYNGISGCYETLNVFENEIE